MEQPLSPPTLSREVYREVGGEFPVGKWSSSGLEGGVKGIKVFPSISGKNFKKRE
jgi:hypothetical protein